MIICRWSPAFPTFKCVNSNRPASARSLNWVLFLYPCPLFPSGAPLRLIYVLETRRASNSRGASGRHLFMSCYRSSRTTV